MLPSFNSWTWYALVRCCGLGRVLVFEFYNRLSRIAFRIFLKKLSKFIHFVQLFVMIWILCFRYPGSSAFTSNSLQQRKVLGYWVNLINFKSLNHILIYRYCINGCSFRFPILLKLNFRIGILATWPWHTRRGNWCRHRLLKSNAERIRFCIILQIYL